MRFNKLGRPSDMDVDHSSTLSFGRTHRGIDIGWVRSTPMNYYCATPPSYQCPSLGPFFPIFFSPFSFTTFDKLRHANWSLNSENLNAWYNAVEIAFANKVHWFTNLIHLAYKFIINTFIYILYIIYIIIYINLYIIYKSLIILSYLRIMFTYPKYNVANIIQRVWKYN